MKIYTKTGDKGQTSLASGNRVPKFHLRIQSYGTVDELNSFIGLLRSQEIDLYTREILITVQHKLFSVGTTLAMDENKYNLEIPQIHESDIILLENEMDQIEATLPPLQNFILPGGHPVVGYTHVCRSICRRAERLVVELAEQTVVDERIIRYLNRLSDYFFMLSRKFMNDFNVEQVIWKSKD